MNIVWYNLEIDFETEKKLNVNRREKILNMFPGYENNHDNTSIFINGEDKNLIIHSRGIRCQVKEDTNIDSDIRAICNIFNTNESQLKAISIAAVIEIPGVTNKEIDIENQVAIMKKFVNLNLGFEYAPFRFDTGIEYEDERYVFSVVISSEGIFIEVSDIVDKIDVIEKTRNRMRRFIFNALECEIKKAIGDI